MQFTLISLDNAERVNLPIFMQGERTEAVPLPQFITRYLEAMNVTIEPSGARSKDMIAETRLGQAIETLQNARTLKSIGAAYEWFLRRANDVSVMLQHDYRQFTYPFFVHLAIQLFKVGKGDDARKFIDAYRVMQPHECQLIIDGLLQHGGEFTPPHFDIQITQFAFDDLMRHIEEGKWTLLSFIISTHINIQVAPYDHDLLLQRDVSDAERHKPSEAPILEPVPVEMKSLSVLFHHKYLNKAPGIHETDDNKLFLTQGLPDVAQFIAYNHNNRVADMHVSPCSRLLSMAIDSNVLVYRLDASTGLSVRGGHKTATLMSHSGRVLTTAFSDDSRYVVSGGMDRQIRVAETEAFRPMAHYMFHVGPILNVAWDHRAGFFLGASQDRTISMWSLRSPDCLRCFAGHTLPVSKVAFSRDNKSVVSCSSDLTVRIWDVGQGNEVAKFRCGKLMPLALDVHPANTMLACGCRNGGLIIWDALSGKHKWTEKPFESPVTDVKFSADGTLLFASSLEGQFCAVALEPEEPAVVMHIEANGATIDSITVTERNLVLTTGRSLRGGVLI